MSVRNLQFLFGPQSVALIGASPRPGSVGQVLMKNLLSQGFAGPVLPVNPHEPLIASVPAWKDVASLPVTTDLAVICTPPAAVPGLIAELGAAGTRAAVVLTAGLDKAQRQAMLDSIEAGVRWSDEEVARAKAYARKVLG